MSPDQELFWKHLPTFTDSEAEALFHQYGRIVSVARRDGPLPGTHLVLFVSEKGVKAGPLVLNSVVAAAFCKMLEDAEVRSALPPSA